LWTLEQLQELARTRINKNTKFIGFSHLYSIWPEQMEQFAVWFKHTYPTVALISGSAVNPMFDSKAIDYYIQGYGEFAIIELLKYITGNGPAPKFNLAASGGRRVISAIHSYPAFPMRSLMVRYEDRDFIQSEEFLTMEFSRGCMFKCSYCNFPVLGVKEDYTRDADDFKLQMQDTYDRFGVTSYLVADETFNDRTEKIKKFADVVEQLDFVPWFSGYIRTDLLVSRSQDKEHLLRMNFLGHFYGIESFNNKSARTIGKGMNSDKLKQGLLDIKKYFETHNRKLYRGHINLIVGLPYETMQSLNDTTSWMFENWRQQSFSALTLEIPTDNFVDTPSELTLNYQKYGYSKLDQDQLAKLRGQSDSLKQKNNGRYHQPRGTFDCIYWQNEHMNYFEAKNYTEQILKNKADSNVFTPGAFQLAYRLQDTPHIEQKLALDYNSYNLKIKNDISQYITKKLNY
jgi:radical SAM superfamily enzyme YgiQ (UPF0313 family)